MSNDKNPAEKLEATLKRRASGELRLDIKGLETKLVKTKSDKPGDTVRERTVYVDPTDEALIAKLMGWDDDKVGQP